MEHRSLTPLTSTTFSKQTKLETQTLEKGAAHYEIILADRWRHKTRTLPGRSGVCRREQYRPGAGIMNRRR